MGNASWGGLSTAEVSPSVRLGDWSSYGSFKDHRHTKAKKLAQRNKGKSMSLALNVHLTNTWRVCSDSKRV